MKVLEKGMPIEFDKPEVLQASPTSRFSRLVREYQAEEVEVKNRPSPKIAEELPHTQASEQECTQQ